MKREPITFITLMAVAICGFISIGTGMGFVMAGFTFIMALIGYFNIRSHDIVKSKNVHINKQLVGITQTNNPFIDHDSDKSTDTLHNITQREFYNNTIFNTANECNNEIMSTHYQLPQEVRDPFYFDRYTIGTTEYNIYHPEITPNHGERNHHDYDVYSDLSNHQ